MNPSITTPLPPCLAPRSHGNEFSQEQVAKAIGRMGPQKTDELNLLEKLVVAREKEDAKELVNRNNCNNNTGTG